MALITCDNVTLSYDQTIVVEDLSFTVNEGDCLFIVGENGSGKSTLMKALLSLKHVEKGEIRFGDGLRPQDIGYLPQQSGSMRDFPASVWEVVISGCQNKRGFKPFYGKEDKQRAEEALAVTNLTDMKKKSYRELSGGQQQRVLLARALCACSRLLLLDEPTTGLDPLMTASFYRLLSSLRERGVTLLVISHDIPAAMTCATHILHMQQRPLFFGTVSDYRQSEAGRRFLPEQ